jgi:hypothetical protein
MRFAQLSRHLYAKTVATQLVKPRPCFQNRTFFSMEAFFNGDSLSAVVRRLSMYESARKHAPVRSNVFI